VKGCELRPRLTFTALTSTFRPGLNPFAPGSMELTYRVENAGNVRLRATRSATVDPVVGPSASSEASDMAELLPGNSYELTQRVPGVWPGGSTRSQVELVPYEAGNQGVRAGTPAVVARTSSMLVPYEAGNQGVRAGTPAVVARTSSMLVPWPQIVASFVAAVLAAWWWIGRRRARRRLMRSVDDAVERALGAGADGRAQQRVPSGGTTRSIMYSSIVPVAHRFDP
jgi:hypothetical protein